MNIGEPSWPDPAGRPGGYGRCRRKLHHWAVGDPAVGLMMCSTSFITRTSSLLRGIG